MPIHLIKAALRQALEQATIPLLFNNEGHPAYLSSITSLPVELQGSNKIYVSASSNLRTFRKTS
jgi:hypothetical protein